MSSKSGDINIVGGTYRAGDGGPGGNGGPLTIKTGDAHSVNFKVLAPTVDPAISKLYDSLGRLSDETSDALWMILTRLRKLELRQQLTKQAVDEIDVERLLKQIATGPSQALKFLESCEPLWKVLKAAEFAAKLAG